MSNYFDRFLEAYKQTTFEFGVADIFTDDSVGVAERTGSFVLLMNQATLGKDGGRVRGVLVVAPPTASNLGCDQKEIETAAGAAAEVIFKRKLTLRLTSDYPYPTETRFDRGGNRTLQLCQCAAEQQPGWLRLTVRESSSYSLPRTSSQRSCGWLGWNA